MEDATKKALKEIEKYNKEDSKIIEGEKFLIEDMYESHVDAVETSIVVNDVDESREHYAENWEEREEKERLDAIAAKEDSRAKTQAEKQEARKRAAAAREQALIDKEKDRRAKELVDKAPNPVKEGLVKADAEMMKKKLEEVGAKVSLK